MIIDSEGYLQYIQCVLNKTEKFNYSRPNSTIRIMTDEDLVFTNVTFKTKFMKLDLSNFYKVSATQFVRKDIVEKNTYTAMKACKYVTGDELKKLEKILEESSHMTFMKSDNGYTYVF